MNRPSSYNECYIPSSVLLEADGCCIDLIECASSSKQRETATINILYNTIRNCYRKKLAMVTANHEDETRSVLGWFLSGSKQKGGNYSFLRSQLAEGS